MTVKKKLLITIACLSVILCALVTGTIAWLTDSTAPIENKFTPSDITVNLSETGFVGKMVPGKTIDKTATVTVTNDIDCYVFLKVEKTFEGVNYTVNGTTNSATFDDFLSYTIANGWNQLKDANGNDVPGVYYREVKVADNDKGFDVLEGNVVTVKSTVNKAMMNALQALGSEKYPTLTFTAYVCQMENGNTNFTPEQAWDIAKPAMT